MFDFSPLWVSLRIATVATSFAFFLGIAAAHRMQLYRGRGRSLLDSLLLSPMVLPPTVLGFLLLLLLGKNGPFGPLLAATGTHVVFTSYAAVMTATVVAFPLMYKTTLGAFEQIDSRFQQAARTLGASELSVFWRITLPLALPGILAGTTLAFARALGEFGATLMLAGNIPGRTQTLPMAIYFAVEGGDFRTATFWSAIVLMLSLGAIASLNRFAYRPPRPSPGSPSSDSPSPDSPPLKKLSHADTSPLTTSSINSDSPISPSTHPCTTYPCTLHLSVNIHKRLHDFTLAVNFATTGRAPLGLLGASGAGKSLLLRCIAGIETPDAGRIILNGRVLFDSQLGINLPSCDRNISILFQNYALFPHLSVAQNVAFGLRQKRSSSRTKSGAMDTAIAQQLAALHLEGLAQRYPHELSGGQQQRVALARALATQPDVLLLDEPFSALDTHLRSQIERQLITRLQSYCGITLLVTHSLEEAYRVCDRLLVIERGQAIAHAPKHEIFEQPRSVGIAQLTGCKNFSEAIIAHGPHQVEALRWQCRLQTVEPIPPNLSQVGIRAHQITFLAPDAPPMPNTFEGWLAATSETPHRMTLYLKLHTFPASEHDYHLQAEIFKEKWILLKDQPLPWKVYLDPLRLVLLEDN
ncbi:MAG: molybdate ABC transporter permease subunit [Phormidesmis sp.]